MGRVSHITPPINEARARQLASIVRSTSTETRSMVSPLNGDVVGAVPVSTTEDVDAAFAAARVAQAKWQETDFKVRKRALLKLHDLLLQNRDELLDLIQIESGKTRAHAFEEISHTALTARYYARRGGKILGPHRRIGAFPVLTRVEQRQQSKGVVGLITPWNYPLTMALSDGLAAIAAGNAVVAKPDSQSPFTALAAVELFRRAGFPQELWQVVSGPGTVVGTAIIQQADYICFTGSTATGRRIAAQASERLVGYSLELGGKNPLIVLPGADIKQAVSGAITASFSSAGQLCVSTERIFVHSSQYEKFRDKFVKKVSSLKLGTGLNWKSDMGTLVSSAQLAVIEKHVADAIDQGATVLTGGKARPDLGPWFYEPTVLENVPAAAECYAEETFGPLVSIYPYDTIDQVVREANNTEYGLNSSIWGPTKLAHEVARQIKSGTVNINEGFAATFGSIDAPMGGTKSSGVGRRQGAEGLLRFTESQAIGRQSLIPVAGPKFLSTHAYSRVLSVALAFLRRTPRP